MCKGLCFYLVVLLPLVVGCKDKKLTPSCNGDSPTYDNGISAIINAECNGTTCHATGASQAEFTSYAGMALSLSNGNFEKKVLIDQTMPRNDFLTQDQIDLIQCWVDNGYPEN